MNSVLWFNLFDKPLRLSFAAGIGAYQRYISPYKGFSCAHRLLYGGESCSQFAKRVVLTEGVVIAWRELGFRLRECKEANRILKARRVKALVASSEVSEESEEEYGDFPEDPRYPPRRSASLPYKRRSASLSNNHGIRACLDETCSSCYIFPNDCDCDCGNFIDGSNEGGNDCNPFDGDGCNLDCNPFDGDACSGGDCGDCSNLDCGSCGS